MTTISSPGIGSGLDTSGIVSKLMAVEAIPLNQLTSKENAIQTKLTAYGQVQSGLSSFQSSLLSLTNINSIKNVSATVSDTSVLTATSSTGAVAGNYNISVSQLAQAQQLVSAGQSSTTAQIGSGATTTLSFNFGTISGTKSAGNTYNSGTTFTSNGSSTKTVTINSSNNTLAGIRDAINAAAIGVSATIINDGSASPNRLLLTNSQTGVSQSMKISVSGDSALGSLLTEDPTSPTNQSFTETTAAQNANLTINGLAVTNASNVLTNNIQGVTMTLNKTNVGSSVNLNLANNASGLQSSITSFISSYNSLNSSLNTLTSYDLTSRTGADLYGESTIKSAQRQMKNILLSALPTGSNPYTLLNNIGITFQKDGTLSADSTKLGTAISTNFGAVANLFAANASPTDSLINFVSSASDTKPGTYAVNIATMPAQGSLTATASPSSLVITPANDTLSIKLNGISSSVKLTDGTYSNAANLAASIQAAINGNSTLSSSSASITVSANASNQLVFTSNRYGAASTVVLGGTGDTASSNLLGGGSGTTSNGVDMVATLNGTAALTSGQSILGPTGTPQSNLKLQVLGGTAGARGTVTYTQGVAYQLNNLINSFTGANGLITVRTTGLNTSITNFETQKAQMQVHLDMLQKQYQSTYTQLDSTVASLNATSSYLTGQLNSIAATSNQISTQNSTK